MHKAQRGHKLNVVSKVVTPLNFVTPPSFSVTPPSYKPFSIINISLGHHRSFGGSSQHIKRGNE